MGKGKLVLGLMTVGVAAIVYGVHWEQKSSKETMHAGVLRDMERLKAKREQMLVSEKEERPNNE